MICKKLLVKEQSASSVQGLSLLVGKKVEMNKQNRKVKAIGHAGLSACCEKDVSAVSDPHG